MVELLFHPEAEAEYLDAIRWYWDRSPNAARNFETQVAAVLSKVLAEPGMFAKYDDVHHFAVVRRFPYSVSTARFRIAYL